MPTVDLDAENGATNGVCLYRGPGTGPLEQHVFFKGQDGSLNQTWYDGNNWNSQRLPGSPVTWPVARSWHGLTDRAISDELHVFYRDISGGLGHTWWGLGYENPPQYGWFAEVRDGRPVGAVALATFNGELHVFYVVADGTLHQTVRVGYGTQGAVWRPSEQVPGNPQGHLPWGLSTLVTYTADASVPDEVPKELHVFYVGSGEELEQSWFTADQGWQQQTLPGRPAGTPRSIVVDAPVFDKIGADIFALQGVFFVEAPGNQALQTSWWDGTRWNNRPLPGSPLGLQLETCAFVPSGSSVEQHVFFVGQDGGLEQTWLDQSGWKHQALPGRPSRILGAGSYFPRYIHALPQEQHVFFRADDGTLGQSWWDGTDDTSWNTQPLPTITPLSRDFGF